jgi:RecJ-like exonuclease
MEQSFQCLECGGKGMVMMCDKCGTVFCSVKCMAKNWEKPTSHHMVCNKIAIMKLSYDKTVKEVLELLFSSMDELVGSDGEEDGGKPPKRKKVKIDEILREKVRSEAEQRAKLQQTMAPAAILPGVTNAMVHTTYRSILHRQE